MKNLLIFVLAIVVALTFSACANAVVHEFRGLEADKFSIDVPNGWTVATEGKSILDSNFPGGTVTITDGTSTITFLFADSEGLYAPTFAIAVAGALGGSDPVENGDGDFEITYAKNGVATNARTQLWGNLGVVMESQSDFSSILSILETLN